MRLLRKLVLLTLLICPAALFAQDTKELTKQANIVAKAIMANDYNTVINYMYPKFVAMNGGKAKVLQLFISGGAQLKQQGMKIINVSVGEPGKFYKAGSEIHCLVPNVINMKVPQGVVAVQGNLLAVSGDNGKHWSFLDLNKKTIASIPKLFPNFNKKLVIPAPKVPMAHPEYTPKPKV